MLKIERDSVMNFENAMRGARNPLNSWARMDSYVDEDGNFVFGDNDIDLAKRLRKAGSDHRKFMRQILVSCDITAPMYWWKEYDTFDIEDFSHDHLTEESLRAMNNMIEYLESIRLKYVETKDKKYWYDLIQLLPSSYNQMRTCTFNYETLVNIYFSRRNHKLDEWHTFCEWIETLPYAKEIIIAE